MDEQVRLEVRELEWGVAALLQRGEHYGVRVMVPSLEAAKNVLSAGQAACLQTVRNAPTQEAAQYVYQMMAEAAATEWTATRDLG